MTCDFYCLILKHLNARQVRIAGSFYMMVQKQKWNTR